jgi:glycosyltransferase involved in cell wall biosynthesis
MDNKRVELSVVSPVYNSQDSIDELVERIEQTLSKAQITYEIILVDDYSKDESWEKISKLSTSKTHLTGIKLSRNFGQHKAITAGLSCAKGEYSCVMDCDLQDKPEDIIQLYEKVKEEKSDIVFTKKVRRSHSIFKNIGARLFNMAFNYLVSDEFVYSNSQIGSFSLLSRRAVDAFLDVKDVHRHYLLILRWLGFKRSYVEVKHDERKYGESSYSTKKLILHALDGITSQSDKLLYMSVKASFGLLLLSLVAFSYVIYRKIYHDLIPGWASIVAVQLLSTSAISVFLGIIGVYLGKTFEQTKNRPLYIIHKNTSENLGDSVYEEKTNRSRHNDERSLS